MAGEEVDYTRLGPRIERHDPHVALDLDALVAQATVGQETSAALTSHAEAIDDKVLDRMAEAQRAAFLEVARAHPLVAGRPLSDEGVIDFVNKFQIGTTVEQKAYLDIVNESIKKAAAALDAQGLGSATLGAAITGAVARAGHSLSGAATDLTKLDTAGILTIVGAGGGTYLLTGSAKWSALAGGIAVAVQSPNLTEATLGLAKGAMRGAGQLVAMPIKGAMRTTDIINALGQPGFVDTVQANAQGLGRDVIDSVAYTFDAEYTPSDNLARNPLLEEFLRLGEAFAPKELEPLLKYMLEVRNGGPITKLPTQAELKTAGAFIKKIEHLVSPEDFIAIDMRRKEGKVLTPEEKQKYILGKYCMIVNHSFIGENGLEPQASLVRAAYEAENGKINDINVALPLTAALQGANLSWTPEQISQFENNVQGLKINFESLTKHGFVGLALTAYLTLTYAGIMIGVGQKALGLKKDPETRQAEKEKPRDEMTLDRHWLNPRRITSNRYKTLENKINSNNAGDIYDQLSSRAGGYNVFAGNKALRKLVKDNSVALDIKNSDDFKAFRTAIIGGSATRLEIRKAFFDGLKAQTAVPDLVTEIAKMETFNEISYQTRSLYRFAKHGGGARSFTVNTKSGEAIDYTIERQDTVSERVHDLAGFSMARGLRDAVGGSFALRYVSGGPAASGNNNTAKAVNFSFNNETGQVFVRQRTDRGLNVNPANWVWGAPKEVTSIVGAAE